MEYNIVAKTLSNCMKHSMPDLIGPYQCSFVPGRQITDNIVIYQEILHSLRKNNSIKGYMVLKIDLEKIYYILEWSFILETLELAGFNTEWSHNIMHCVESSSMSILWNGEPMKHFNPSRGIRQGDSMSPFLFVLYI